MLDKDLHDPCCPSTCFLPRSHPLFSNHAHSRLLSSQPHYLPLTLSLCIGFLGGSVVKNLPAKIGDTRDTGSVPGLGRSPGVGNGSLLQYSCLENSIHRGARQATVQGVAESDKTERLSTITTESVYTISRHILPLNHLSFHTKWWPSVCPDVCH